MKHLTISVLAIALLFSVSSQSHAQNCNSAASVVADIWTKVHDVAIEIGCGGARAMTAGNLNYSLCFNTAGKLNDLTGNLVQFWNSQVNNSWATVGPRRLDLNQNHTGTLVSTGGRKFVSLPVLNKNSITVTIDETGGKGKTSVTVCKINKNNQKTNIGTKWFNDSKQKKKKSNEKQTFTVNGAKDHIVTVHMDGKSVGNTFKYKLRAN